MCFKLYVVGGGGITKLLMLEFWPFFVYSDISTGLSMTSGGGGTVSSAINSSMLLLVTKSEEGGCVLSSDKVEHKLSRSATTRLESKCKVEVSLF